MNGFLKNILYIICLNVFVSCNYQNSYIDRNFSFENIPEYENQWITSSSGGIILRDTNNYVEGNQSWLLTNSTLSQRFSTFIFQYINLPDISREVSLSISSKTEIVNSAWLKAYLLDKDENLLTKDSVSLVSNHYWSKHALKLNCKNAYKLYIEIQAQSKDTFIANGCIQQKLWIDNLELKSIVQNGYNQAIPFYESDQSQANPVMNYITINKRNPNINEILDFKQPRIIALGESVHGSNEIQFFVFESIKNMISNNNCKLLLFELPFEIGLRLNDYVTTEKEEDIEKLLTFFNYNTTEIQKLFEWIKDFNKQEKNKVHISGLDINHSFLKENHLLAFLENQTEQTSELEAVTELIKKNKYNSAMITLKRSKYIQSSLGRTKYESILWALKCRNGLIRQDPSLIEGKREYIQFQNAKFAIDSFLKPREKAIIYAHLGHVNKRNSTYTRLNIPSFGNYMNKQYPDNYFTTALLVGIGSITSNNSLLQCGELTIQYPIEGSLEKFCMENSKDEVFYQHTNGINWIQSYRVIGSYPKKKQFYPFVPKVRFDAFVFFRHSTSYQVSKVSLNK